MDEHLVSKIINLCVAYMDVGEGREQERKLCKLSNSGAITCVPRLDLDYFASQSDSPRLNRRFPRFFTVAGAVLDFHEFPDYRVATHLKTVGNISIMAV